MPTSIHLNPSLFSCPLSEVVTCRMMGLGQHHFIFLNQPTPRCPTAIHLNQSFLSCPLFLVVTCSIVVLKWLMAAHCLVSTGNQDSTLEER